MGENNPPSLEELGDGDELPNHWQEETTITVTRYTKARLDENRDGVPWDTYLETLRREHADPLTLSDADDVAREVVERLEGSKPLAEMEFEDWFEPDYAQTIASHIESEIALGEVPVTLDASERAQIARDVAEELQR